MEEKEDNLVFKDAIRCSLEALSKMQDLIDRPLFYYSLSEYYENLNSISLVGSSEKAIQCRTEITSVLKNLII